jgi:hypothetical protein
MASDGCGSPDQSVELAGLDTANQTVLAGTVVAGAEPVGGAFVRLLDSSGEFTGEVVSSAAGQFRFFAGPGEWTVRALHRSGNGQAAVTAAGPGVHELTVCLV